MSQQKTNWNQRDDSLTSKQEAHTTIVRPVSTNKLALKSLEKKKMLRLDLCCSVQFCAVLSEKLIQYPTNKTKKWLDCEHIIVVVGVVVVVVVPIGTDVRRASDI